MTQTLERPIEKPKADIISAALRAQERKIRDLLVAIEMNDAAVETIHSQIRLVEESLRRLRTAAA